MPPRILYLTHDVADATTRKRVAMLRAGGATVVLAGFRRVAEALSALEDGTEVIDLGHTQNGRFLQRIASVLRIVLRIKHYRSLFRAADVVLARNLEMLAIAVAGAQAAKRGKALPIFYECLDIHRLMLRADAVGHVLRAIERELCKNVRGVIVSSPAFVREYFAARTTIRRPTYLLENKVFGAEPVARVAGALGFGPPWRIGWFGVIRCRKSLALLDAFTRAHPGLCVVEIRGRLAHDQLPEVDSILAANPALRFHGPYRNPEDLASLYHGVHFSWAMDWYEEGQNSRWLLPNRLYEGGLYGAVPLAEEGTETAHYMAMLGIGGCLAAPVEASLAKFLGSLTPMAYAALANAAAALPATQWLAQKEDCLALVRFLAETT